MIEIFQAETSKHIEHARKLFREYEAWLDVDLCFQSFEEELENLPGKYSAPEGGLFLAAVDGKVAGCIAFRKIDDKTCEMKRLFVREDFRGFGLGGKLIEKFFEKARDAGYLSVLLDTLADKMPSAIRLYKSFGFTETKPYYQTPLRETIFMQYYLQN
jgi:GNAT superfamily N-acetyltransferase